MQLSNTKINRIYNTEYRRKLVSKIDKLNNKIDFIYIYNLIINDINNVSYNNNGVFININLLSDKCIEEINKYTESKLNKINDDTKINYKVYKFDDVNVTHKFSNQDKSIIKRIRNTSN